VELQISPWRIRHLLVFRNRYRASENGGHDRSYGQDTIARPTGGNGIIVSL
jgi:hypothetical protein